MKRLIIGFILVVFFNGCYFTAGCSREDYFELEANSKIQKDNFLLTLPDDGSNIKWELTDPFASKELVHIRESLTGRKYKDGEYELTETVLTRIGDGYVQQIQILYSYNDFIFKETEEEKYFPRVTGSGSCGIPTHKRAFAYNGEIAYINLSNIKDLKCFISRDSRYNNGVRLACNYYKTNGELDRMLIYHYLKTNSTNIKKQMIKEHLKTMNDIISNIELKDIDLKKTKEIQ